MRSGEGETSGIIFSPRDVCCLSDDDFGVLPEK